MFERFTDGARRAVVLAQESARDLHHDRITVQHLLIGIAEAHQGEGTAALADQGVAVDRLRQAVRSTLPAGGSAPTGHMPFTPAAKKAMELSLRESMTLGADSIDNGHMLLALLRHGGDQLPAVLTAAGLDRTALGTAVEQRLAATARDSPDPPSIDRGQLTRIETLLMDVQARLTRIEARLDRL